MLSQLFSRRKSLSKRKLSLVLQPNSVTVAVVEGAQRFIKQLSSHSDNYVSSIKLLSQEVELSHSHCQIILAHGLYQGTQVDNPSAIQHLYYSLWWQRW